MIKSLIFDFGGTIDTDGIHWIEKFWNSYKQHSINISREQFVEAYIFAEQRMNDMTKIHDSFSTTLINQLSLQFDYLEKNNIWICNSTEINSIAMECYSGVKRSVSHFKKIIKNLEGQFSFAVVSNFYGNLESVLKEFDIKKIFKVITDSTLVNIRKPEPEIFLTTLKKLSVYPQESFVIGDSYENDIKPAKEIGCGTIWLIKKKYDRKEDKFYSDYKISSINQLKSVLKPKHILQ